MCHHVNKDPHLVSFPRLTVVGLHTFPFFVGVSLVDVAHLVPRNNTAIHQSS
jgi:hypothetical protein